MKDDIETKTVNCRLNMWHFKILQNMAKMSGIKTGTMAAVIAKKVFRPKAWIQPRDLLNDPELALRKLPKGLGSKVIHFNISHEVYYMAVNLAQEFSLTVSTIFRLLISIIIEHKTYRPFEFHNKPKSTIRGKRCGVDTPNPEIANISKTGGDASRIKERWDEAKRKAREGGYKIKGMNT